MASDVPVSFHFQGLAAPHIHRVTNLSYQFATAEMADCVTSHSSCSQLAAVAGAATTIGIPFAAAQRKAASMTFQSPVLVGNQAHNNFTVLLSSLL